MKTHLAFPAKVGVPTATDLAVVEREVIALANGWNITKKWYEPREPRDPRGESQLLASSDLATRVARAKLATSLEGLLVEPEEWLAGGHGAVYASRDRGVTWEPKLRLRRKAPISSVVRHEGALWVLGPFGDLAREDARGKLVEVPLPRATTRRRIGYDGARPYPEVGTVRLKVVGGELFVLGHGLWRWNGHALETEIESTTLLVDLDRTADGGLLACGILGRFLRRLPGAGWEPLFADPAQSFVAVVALPDGVLRVAKKGVDALAWSTDEGASFTPLVTSDVGRTHRFHLAIPDGHGGALVSGFHGLLLRVSREGGLGPWAPGAKEAPTWTRSEDGAPGRAETATPTPSSEPSGGPRARPSSLREGSSLLEAVLVSPDDDGPRLVYADWLGERGDPRGEFIQLQCLLQRPIYSPHGEPAANRPPPTHPDAAALTRREHELWAAHERTWLAPVRAFLRSWTWWRGFLGLVVSNPAFLDGAGLVLTQHPVSTLRLQGLDVAALERLSRTPLPHLRRLVLESQRISSRAARHLTSPVFARLTFLDLSCNPIRDGGLTLLAREAHLGQLEELDLAACDVTDEGVAALAQGRGLERLAIVNLRRNRIGRRGFDALLEGSLPSLTRVIVCAGIAGAAGEDGLRALRERYEVVVEG